LFFCVCIEQFFKKFMHIFISLFFQKIEKKYRKWLKNKDFSTKQKAGTVRHNERCLLFFLI